MGRSSGSTASAERGSPGVLTTAPYLTSTLEQPHHPGMDRRRFLLTSLAGALVAPLVANTLGAQPPKTARVGVLASSTEANFAPSVRIFHAALHGAGWDEGRNLTIVVRYPGERYTRLPEQAAELVSLKVDVIASLGTPATLAAKRATTTIPIVMESLSDVVAIGLVPNLARPGGNITGVSGFAPELSGKRLELIREMFPRAERIAALANRANPVTVPILRATESAAQQIRMKLHVIDVRQPAELEAAFETMGRERTDALVLVADPFLFSERPLIIQLAARHRLPAVYETRLFPEAGGLLSYGPLPQERFERMAVYVDRILRGARPGELAIEQPTKFELVINLKTAKALGLTIPPSLLARADQVIE
jgi:putative tryptophan/tyrosine transport system substrate-binding protein